LETTLELVWLEILLWCSETHIHVSLGHKSLTTELLLLLLGWVELLLLLHAWVELLLLLPLLLLELLILVVLVVEGTTEII
jgi:hypothetical protein